MAVVWMEGFDCYDDIYDMMNYAGYWFNTYSYTILEDGYKSGKAFSVTNDGSYNNFYKDPDLSEFPLSGIWGFWLKRKYREDPNSSLLYFSGTSSQQSVGIAVLGHDYDYRLQLVYNYNQAIDTNVYLPQDIWYHFELKYQIANSTTMPNELRVNGVKVAELPIGTDTLYSTDTIYKIRGVYEVLLSLDHMYILDFTGDTANDWLGPNTYIKYLQPIANGNTNDWTPSPATGLNWDSVDERVTDGQDTYVYSSTSGDKELYDMGDLGSNVDEVISVQNQIHAATSGYFDNIGVKLIERIPSSGTDYAYYIVTGLLPTFGFYKSDIYNENPVNNQPWTTGDIGNNEFGFELWWTGA